MLMPAPSFRLRGAPSASWTARTPDSTGRLVGASFYHGHLVGGPYLENMNRSLWLQCNESRLVELHSSRRVEVRTSSDGSLGVWLCGDGPDVLLFEGPESGSYLAGLAEILAAGKAEEVLRYGGRSPAA